MKKLFFALLLLAPLTGCAGINKLVDQYASNTGQQNQTQNNVQTTPIATTPTKNAEPDQLYQSGTSESQPIILNAPRVSVRQINTDALLSWTGVDKAVTYEIYRSYAYPSKTSSYDLIGTTSASSYMLVEAYYGPIQYYSVRAVSKLGVKSGFSDYIVFMPKPEFLD